MAYHQLKSLSLKLLVLSFTLLMFAFVAVAQQAPEYSDEDIEEFIEANKKVATIQQENQEAMVQAIEGADLDVDRFNEIMQAQQGQDAEADVSSEEMESFQSAAEEVMAIQNEMQQKIEKALEDDMGAEKYQQMMMAYQSDPAFQQKVNELLQH